MKSCVECKFYNRCQDPNKRWDYSCVSFKRIKSVDSGSILDIIGLDAESSYEEGDISIPHGAGAMLSESEAEDKERSLIAYLDDAMSSDTPLPKDLKFDDRDIKEFPNFYEWCMSKKGANTPPFARQLMIGIHLFGEYCLHGDSLVPTERGLLRLKEVCENPKQTGMNDLNIRVGTLEGSAKSTYGGLISKNRKCLKVTDTRGQSLIVTPEHKFAILNHDYSIGWKEARNLSSEDVLISALGRNLWSKSLVMLPEYVYEGANTLKRFIKYPKTFNSDFAYWLGLLLGDGYFNTNSKVPTGYSGIAFCNSDKSVIDAFSTLGYKLFGLKALISETDTSNCDLGTGITFWYVQFHSIALVEFLSHIGVPIGNSFNKGMPEFVYKSPKKVVCSFISGLIDTDGYVTNNTYRIGLGMSNENIVSGVQQLLTNLGVCSNISMEYKDPTRKSNVNIGRVTGREDSRNYFYRVEVTQLSHSKTLSSLLTLRNQQKVRVISEILSMDDETPSFANSSTKRYRDGVLPFGKELYIESKSRRKYYNEPCLAKVGRASCFYISNLYDCVHSVQYLMSRMPEYHSNIQKSVKRGLVFAHVKSVEAAGSHPVYDITVPRGENFIANGIVVHNCSRCSHEKAQSIYTIPYRASPEKVAENVQFLNYGVCPKCGVTKSELVNNGEINLYDETALCLGQRSGKCVVGGTLVHTREGFIRIEDLITDSSTKGFTPYDGVNCVVLENGKTAPISHNYVEKKEYTLKVTMSNGMQIEGTFNHPILTKDSGWQTLSELRLDTPIDIVFGQKKFGGATQESIKTLLNFYTLTDCTLWDRIPSYVLRGDGKAQMHIISKLSRKRSILTAKGFAILHKSSTVLREMQVMLHNMGIRCRVKESNNRTDHRLTIEGREALCLYKLHIGLADLPIEVKAWVEECLFDDASMDYTNVSNTYTVWVERIEASTGKSTTYDITVPVAHRFMANGLVSHNSAMFSLLAPYVTHKYLKLQNPNRLFGQMESNVLTATFVGLTFSRAVSLLWTPVLNVMRDSEWYKSYHEMMASYEARYGVVACVVKDTFIEYRHRRLRNYPSGPNKRTLRGDTRYMFGIDELGWFHMGDDGDDERERASGAEVHGALDRSLKTIRNASKKKILSGYNNMIGAYGMSLSSPAHKKDMIMNLTTFYENSSEVLALRMPTWKMNPQYRGKEDFAKEYAKDYAKAERDFGANPIVNENRVMSDATLLDVASNCILPVTINTKRVLYTSQDQAFTSASIDRLVPNDYPSVLSLDAGATNNSFAMTLLQKSGDSNSTLRVAAFIDIIPFKDSTIHFNRLFENVIEPILKAFNVCGVVSDRWESTMILHTISEKYGIFVKHITAKPVHFTLTDSYIRPDCLVKFPRLDMSLADILAPNENEYKDRFSTSPNSHFIYQLSNIQEIQGVWYKGAVGTDDIVRSFVLAMSLILDESFASKYLKSKIRQTSMVGIGAMSGLAGGNMYNDQGGGGSIAASSQNTGGFDYSGNNMPISSRRR